METALAAISLILGLVLLYLTIVARWLPTVALACSLRLRFDVLIFFFSSSTAAMKRIECFLFK